MAEDYERLQRQIEEGLRAVRELKKMAAKQKREERPKLKVLRGGLLGGALCAGVEWLRSYKLGVAIAATAVTIGGGVIAEHPGSPSADPPAQTRPAHPRSSAPPSTPPKVVAPTPRRTSPPRTYARVTPAEPERTIARAPTKTPQAHVPQAKDPQPSKPPPKVKLPRVRPSLPVKTPSVIPTIPVVVETPECTGIGLLGLCILGN